MVIFILFLLIIFLVFPVNIALATKDALNMCINSVIPSLFPFMVASKMLAMSGDIGAGNIFFKAVGRIFKISEAGVTAFLMGLICGYPVGAKMISELLEQKRITKKEATRLMLFSNNAGPAFTIATVGGMFFSDVKTGVIIYLCHIISSIIIALVTSFFAKTDISSNKTYVKSPPFFKMLTVSIADSVLSVLNVSGIIVFFSALLKIFDIINLASILPPQFVCILKGMFEMTSGIKALSSSDAPYIIKVIFSSFLVSFSGFSVYAQMLAFLKGMKITPCIIAKTLGAVLSMVLCYIVLII